MKFFILVILYSMSSMAFNLETFEGKILVPDNVRKLQTIKDKKSIEYQIVSYEAAMDLHQLAKMNYKIGNLVKALHFMELATKLFAYRDDLVNFYNQILQEFTAETNNLISKKNISCENLKVRVRLIQSASPRYANKIIKNKISCNVDTGHKLTSISDVDIDAWISAKLPENVSENRGSVTANSDDFFMQAKIQKVRAIEKHKQESRIYKLQFPKLEIILSSLKVLGNFGLEMNLKVITDEKGETFLGGQYIVNTGDSLSSIENHCRSISRFFTLPENVVGSFLFTDKSLCGVDRNYSGSDTSRRFYNNSWEFSGVTINLMSEASKHTDDNPKSNKALFKLFPRFLDMDLIYYYKNKSPHVERFQLKISSIDDFFKWFYVGNKIEINAPEIVENKANITFSKFNQYNIPIKNIGKLKGLRDISIKFNPKRTFDRLVKKLDVRQRK